MRVVNTSPDGAWRIAVSEVDSSIHLSRLSPSGSVTTSPQGWVARAGWFAFIESESKVWAYDGDRALLLMTAAEGVSGTYGPAASHARYPSRYSRVCQSQLNVLSRHMIEWPNKADVTELYDDSHCSKPDFYWRGVSDLRR